MDIFKRHAPNEFLSTPSARRATAASVCGIVQLVEFLSTPSARRATAGRGGFRGGACQFLSTPSARRATQRSGCPRWTPGQFLSTPSARRATVSVLNAITDLDVFLSTPSARRATLSIGAICCARCYFYPRPPRGGRPRSWTSTTAMPNFYPRPPRGGRRGMPDLLLVQGGISIHALREEGDPEGICLLVQGVQFLSTPSARRATSHRRCCRAGLGYFYPRPPRGGRRSALGVNSGRRINFYPRPPRGGRQLPLVN